jgi:23S rRNA pseudouridine2604 synthase
MEKFVRLSKLMSELKICSRREAEAFIDLKQVLVDGKLITAQGTKVAIDSKIELLSDAKKLQENKVVIILNKPEGIVSTQPQKGYIAAIELVLPKNQIRNGKTFDKLHLEKLAVAGRLDIRIVELKKNIL